MILDAIDRAIIDELEINGRLSNVALADAVHLTPGPCLRRVQRLEADGVIRGYRAITDPAALGRGFEVLLEIGVTRFDKATIERFESTLAAYDEVVELRRMFGSPDYFARVAVADQSAYEEFLTEQVMVIDGVATISSRFAIKVIKSPQ
ncbi:MAG: Lrp/AsnC family transcriptional regulator, partial [Gordonia sp. (in: high G+C Gram-positive bacteria)]|uniref:Lrp/AsnC family transcriptional regulator n=1 Tax=Gordonia sp. (in: high G+C Gram-positive bacteria) TaxID=84139 RepID=UPI003BB74B76